MFMIDYSLTMMMFVPSQRGFSSELASSCSCAIVQRPPVYPDLTKVNLGQKSMSIKVCSSYLQVPDDSRDKPLP